MINSDSNIVLEFNLVVWTCYTLYLQQGETDTR